MIELAQKKEDCCGCKACGDLCPKMAISFETDEEGFWYPVIHQEKCVECGMCERVCPQLVEITEKKPMEVYAVQNKNAETVLHSSSGGVFSALAEAVIRAGGHVYGVIYDENIRAKFFCAKALQDLERMRGSKYVQADSEALYKNVLNDLKNNVFVLCVGTPCQIAAMRTATEKYKDHILLVDFICHGVPSPLLFNQFKTYVEKKRKKRIVQYYNRSKVEGWKQKEEIVFQDGSREYSTLLSQGWRHIFYSGNAFRTTCYACRFNHYAKRFSDLTIADYWGVEQAHPNIPWRNGVSLLCAYTEAGRRWLERIGQNCEMTQSEVARCLNRQPHFRGTSVVSGDRKAFWVEYAEKGIGYIIRKYGKCDFICQSKYFVKKMFKKLG